MNIIGICGYARSGKNLFADIASTVLKNNNKKVVQLSLANKLKEELYSTLVDKVNISPFTEDDTEKKLIRPMLVAYGNLMRNVSNGTYWTDILENVIMNEYADYDYIFVTDIRYCEYESDEIFWLKNKMNGKLVHISRYELGSDISDKLYIQPANEHELKNDPKLKEYADECLEWESIGNSVYKRYMSKLQVINTLSKIGITDIPIPVD
jgi:hypothetical protein